MARRMKCRPLTMPEVFKWGDTNPHWDQAVDQFLAMKRANRLCEMINYRSQRGADG